MKCPVSRIGIRRKCAFFRQTDFSPFASAKIQRLFDFSKFFFRNSTKGEEYNTGDPLPKERGDGGTQGWAADREGERSGEKGRPLVSNTSNTPNHKSVLKPVRPCDWGVFRGDRRNPAIAYQLIPYRIPRMGNYIFFLPSFTHPCPSQGGDDDAGLLT